MKQYLDLLKEIKEKGTYKPAARGGLPGSLSLFGAQFRHDLSEGFPLLTTKKMFWKGVVVELLWFLRGDTNIKYLVDNGCNFWNEDAYNYYVKLMKEEYPDMPHLIHTLDRFLMYTINDNSCTNLRDKGYKYGDCGYQYGRTWRSFGPYYPLYNDGSHKGIKAVVDQIASLIYGLKTNLESRRHIVTSIDPVHSDDLALFWCHAMFQMNCRPLDLSEKTMWLDENPKAEEYEIPLYYLDCHMYQRSADAFLG